MGMCETKWAPTLSVSHLSSHLSLNREDRWGTTDDFTASFLHFFPVLHCRQGLGELQACPFPDIVFPPLPLSALTSPHFHFPPFTVPCKMVLARLDERET